MDTNFIELLLNDASARGSVAATKLKNCRELAITGLGRGREGQTRVPPVHGNCHLYALVPYEGYVFVGSFDRTDYAVETAELIAQEASPFCAITIEGR